MNAAERAARNAAITHMLAAGQAPDVIASYMRLSERTILRVAATKLEHPRQRGRPRLGIPPQDKAYYRKLRRHYGMAEARRMWGTVW